MPRKVEVELSDEEIARGERVARVGHLLAWAEDAIGATPGLSREHRVTVRLTSDDHKSLERLAGMMGMTKSGCLEEIAANAILDVMNHFGLHLPENDPDQVETSGDAAAQKGRS